MIIVKILGGLGNQLFQYSFYNYLVSKGYDVKVDVSDFQTYKLHNGLEIEKYFDIKWEKASKNEVADLKDFSQSYFAKFRRVILNKQKKSHIKEDHFDVSFLTQDANLYLDGYWQNERFIKQYFSKICEMISFKQLVINSENKRIHDLISDTESVGIHIRRGDYLLAKNKKIFHTCDLGYYNKGLKYYKNKDKDFTYFIFSDDIEWAKQNLKIDNSIYIDFNTNENSIYDLYLMSLCKNLIIANSTYSWWAAVIQEQYKNIVIAPKYWQKNNNHKMYLPKDWVIIENN